MDMLDEFLNKITVNEQNSIRVEGKKKVYFDPYKIENEAHDADVIFITHSHAENFSPEDIAKVSNDRTWIIAPKGMKNLDKNKKFECKGVLNIKPGQRMAAAGMEIEGIAAYNILKPFHAKLKGWMGYIVTIEGTRLFVSGDTDLTNDIKQVSCDIAMVPIGGFATMDVEKAAAYVNETRPQAVIPVNYTKAEDGTRFSSLVDTGIKVDLRLGHTVWEEATVRS
jgi:L-ascorbate metabolism protein UlaG (beta-lactamase superfamily)